MQISAGGIFHRRLPGLLALGALIILSMLIYLDQHPRILAPTYPPVDGLESFPPTTFPHASSSHADVHTGVASPARGTAPAQANAAPASSTQIPQIGLLLPPVATANDKSSALTGALLSATALAGWYNFLEQSFGPVHMLRSVSAEQLQSFRVLVVPAISQAALSSGGPPAVGTSPHAPALPSMRALQEAVEAGLVLLVEEPMAARLPPEKAASTSPQGWVVTRSPLELPTEAGSLLGKLDTSAFLLPPPSPSESMLTDRLLPGREAGDEPLQREAFLRTEGRPLITVRGLGNGALYSVHLQLGAFFQHVQQGAPDADGELRNRYPSQQSLPLETNDLVIQESLLTARWPIIDLLEDALADDISLRVNLPRLWLYPKAAPGALLITHDEESMGDKALWMAEADAEQGCTSTNFIVPGPIFSESALSRVHSLGAEIALHSILTGSGGEIYPGTGLDTDGRFQTIGLWKIQPVWRLLPPVAQAAFLRSRTPAAAAIVASRTHFLAWPREHGAYFGALMNAGIQIDSSYGPDIVNRGFLFGTGRPFHPAGQNGLPLPIEELPFVAAEDLGGAGPDFVATLLQDSARKTAQSLTFLYHPNAFRWHPSVPAYQTWRGLCGEGKRLGFWTTTLGGLARFQLARRGATVEAAALPTASNQSLTIDRALQLSLPQEGMTLKIPLQWGAYRLSDVKRFAETPPALKPVPVLSPAPATEAVQIPASPIAPLPTDPKATDSRSMAPLVAETSQGSLPRIPVDLDARLDAQKTFLLLSLPAGRQRLNIRYERQP